mmetsp:Transcript_43073/g.52237  ORF Transcript_43073/g.52237 Transcript_43073/m.52237 type:complete len:168 (+) Transcript_43073:216-719(+)|eukprot:CAMPEP_0197866462 /NCGR_PEP_ID=MMETSP1438-20131217/44228_1 /TAXON_ID=1461541 /ORGANISM="Pterosperma sp., Strain CCMP1384" /LENGTH=167 /DNA_ID=CAMNT_0043485031 /DNA_START=207 /DNA_END=710 /DNA_ORIENTATION=-
MGYNTTLSAEEIEACREAFKTFDKDGSGTIDITELKSTLSITMGQQPTDEELFLMISQVDDDGSGEIEFGEFLKVMENNKWLNGTMEGNGRSEDETDTIEAFVALGGNKDKTGSVSFDRLRQVIADFDLTVDVDKLIAETDLDASGNIDYNEFKLFFKNNMDKKEEN